ncbi:RVT-2 domain containing protein [Pyrenophora tritici-repentis]|nr:RVT-2 domain containing protein [Pyrenophora tritici-repentis]
MDGPWSDFKHTYIPGINETWEDRASYKTLNAVVMSATLDPSVPQALDSGDRPHRDVLPEPPLTWRELQSHSMRPLFMDASNKEIDLLRKKGTWTEIPMDQVPDKPLPLKWVWTYKCDQDGYLDRGKARIVVRGDLQEKDSLDSTYAATLAAKSFRTAMAIAAEFDMEIMQFDVVGAFLNAKITAENPVFCQLPDGFKKPGMCVRLNRALYGLRDSPLLWYEEFSGSLRKAGLECSKEEPCLFLDKDRKFLLLFYVDDILLMFRKEFEDQAMELWKVISSKYEIKAQGPVKWFLGVRVIRDRDSRTITLVHDTYIDKITKKFGLEDGTFPFTPLPSEELIKSDGEATKQQIKAYQERVGSVLYTAIMLRPDVAFAVSRLSHFLTNPSDQHMKAVERVIMYLYRTRWDAIRYGHYNGPDLVICGDASFADDPETRRSSHGYIAMLFGGAIFWKATRQSTVTTSTTEAELLALEHTAKEAMALKRFFKELTLDLGDVWKIWCDNQQTIRLVVGKNERITTRLRHVDIQNMWLRQEHAKGSFQVEYLETSSMPADGLTKSLTQQQFEKFKAQLNL